MLAFLTAGLLLAGPAAAVDDGTRPQARVTNGPSCHPGGFVVSVVAGSVPYRVVLATTRRPGGEDSADLQPGGTAVLRTGDVDYGETIDSRLEYTALDGSGESYVDELEPFTFTRPSAADCAAVSSPAPGVVPPMGPLPPLAPGNAVPGDAAGDARPAGATGPQPPHVRVRTAAEASVATPASPWTAVISGLALLAAAGGLATTVVGTRRARRGA